MEKSGKPKSFFKWQKDYKKDIFSVYAECFYLQQNGRYLKWKGIMYTKNDEDKV